MNHMRSTAFAALLLGLVGQAACQRSRPTSVVAATAREAPCHFELRVLAQDALRGPLVVVAETEAGPPTTPDAWILAQVFVLDPGANPMGITLAPCRRVRQWHAYAPGRPRWSSPRDLTWGQSVLIDLPAASGDSPYLLHERATGRDSGVFVLRERTGNEVRAEFRPEWAGGDSLRQAAFLTPDRGAGGLLFLGGPIQLPTDPGAAMVTLEPGGWRAGGAMEAIRRKPDDLGAFEHRRLAAYQVHDGGEVELLWLVRKFGSPSTWPLDGLAPSVGFATDSYVRIRDLRESAGTPR